MATLNMDPYEPKSTFSFGKPFLNCKMSELDNQDALTISISI